MRAHSQRRVIWFLNVILGAGLVALIAWIVLDVTKAVADPAFLRPAWAEKAVEDFREQPTDNRSALKPPVSLKELDEIDRREFKTKSGRRFHWIYSGPMPKPPPVEEEPEEAAAPVEDDLTKLGEIAFLMFIGPRRDQEVAEETIVFWEFSEKSRKAFSPGEFIHEGDTQPTSGIRLVDVRRKPERERLFDIHYEVVNKDGEVVKKGVYLYDGVLEVAQEIQDVIRVPGGAGGSAGSGTTPEGRTGTGVTGTMDEGLAPGSTPVEVAEEKMVVYETPERARVEVDQGTFDWLRNKSADDLGKSVSTQVARDEQGQVIGLQITGLAAETPADRFDVKPGDILVSIDGKAVKSRSDAMNIAQGIDPDTTRVTVVVDRKGRMITFNIDPRDPKTRRAARALDNR